MRVSGILVGLLLVCQLQADERLLVGVASNFAETLKPIAEAFAAANSADVQLSSGSSGKLFAQIQNGAPYDVFLSADQERPQRLVDAGMSVEPATRLYAVGQLMAWSADSRLADSACLEALRADASARVAIANPRTAPYGRAGLEVLKTLFPGDDIQTRLITGENIAQAAQFAAQGGARFGLLAWSQRGKLPTSGCQQRIDADLHRPIEQHAIALRGESEDLALRFLDYLQRDAAPVIEAAGYRVNIDE